jgi:hypothetical protein
MLAQKPAVTDAEFALAAPVPALAARAPKKTAVRSAPPAKSRRKK